MKISDAPRTPTLRPQTPEAPTPTAPPPSPTAATPASRQARDSDAFAASSNTPAARLVAAEPAPRWTPAPTLDNVRRGGGLVLLGPGMEGEPVRDLQRLLGLPAAEQDGKFGEATRAAVRTFQQSTGLKPPPGQDGYVGPTTLQVLEKAAASGAVGGGVDLNAQLRSPDSLISRAIGHAEGNRALDGSRTQAYYGHTDPGNGVHNQGTFSYQHGAASPQEADQKQLARFREQLPGFESAARAAGLDPRNPLLAAAYFDTFTQAPLAANGPGGFLDQLPELARKGVTPENIVEARVKSYYDPSTGRLDAPGFGNDVNRLRADQIRRTEALAAVVSREAPGDTSRPPATTQGSPTTPTTQGPPQWKPAPSLTDVAKGQGVLRQGMQGESVAELQRMLGVEADGRFGQQTAEAVSNFQRARGLVPPPGMEGQVGATTLATLKKAATAGPVTGNVNPHHPILQRLATGPLSNGATGTCVATTLDNMDALGVPNFPGGTAADPNNPRGAMVRMMREAGWVSVPLPGSRQETIHSPAFGTVQAHVISADAYERMAQAGQIPSGALIFQTRHGWDYNDGPYGNDMGIVRDNGRVTHNYASMPPIIYGDAKDVVLLVPPGALQ